MSSLAVEKYFHAPDARLSEGITYMSRAQELLWVDCYRGEIHRVTSINDPENSYTRYIISPQTYRTTSSYPYAPSTEERVGCIFPVERGDTVEIRTILFGAKYGIGKLDTATGEWEYIYQFRSSKIDKDWSRLRSNDGNISPNGGDMYVGLMTDFHVGGADTSKPPEGCWLRVNLQRMECQMVLDEIYVPNAVNWSPNYTKIYLTDSLNFKIWEAPFECGAPVMDRKRLFYTAKNESNKQFASPEPDGSFVDPRDGHIFTAIWSAGKIQEINPCGMLVDEYILPTPNVSCCCLGPEGNIYVTTAFSGDFETGTGSDGIGGDILKLSILKLKRKGVASSKNSPLY